MPDLLQRSTRDKDPSTNHFFLFLSSFNRRLSTAYSFFGVIVQQVKLIECPRDAWQGLADFIPTETKAEYLKELIVAGFRDRKSTRLNSSHMSISYAVFCL